MGIFLIALLQSSLIFLGADVSAESAISFPDTIEKSKCSKFSCRIEDMVSEILRKVCEVHSNGNSMFANVAFEEMRLLFIKIEDSETPNEICRSLFEFHLTLNMSFPFMDNGDPEDGNDCGRIGVSFYEENMMKYKEITVESLARLLNSFPQQQIIEACADKKTMENIKKLDFLMDKHSVSCQHSVLEVVGYTITLREIEQTYRIYEKKCSFSNIVAIALNSVYIEGILQIPEVNITIFAYKWFVDPNGGFDLRTQSGIEANFLGFGVKFDSEELKITSCGGMKASMFVSLDSQKLKLVQTLSCDDNDVPYTYDPDELTWLKVFKRNLKERLQSYPEEIAKKSLKMYGHLLRNYAYQTSVPDFLLDLLQFYQFQVNLSDRKVAKRFLKEMISYTVEFFSSREDLSPDEGTALRFVEPFLTSLTISSESYYKETIVDLDEEIELVPSLLDNSVKITHAMDLRNVTTNLQNQLQYLATSAAMIFGDRIAPELYSLEETIGLQLGDIRDGRVSEVLSQCRSLTIMKQFGNVFNVNISKTPNQVVVLIQVLRKALEYSIEERKNMTIVLHKWANDLTVSEGKIPLLKFAEAQIDVRKRCKRILMSDWSLEDVKKLDGLDCFDTRKQFEDLERSLLKSGTYLPNLELRTILVASAPFQLDLSETADIDFNDFIGNPTWSLFRENQFNLLSIFREDLVSLLENDREAKKNWKDKYRVLSYYKYLLQQMTPDLTGAKYPLREIVDKYISIFCILEHIDNLNLFVTLNNVAAASYPIQWHISDPELASLVTTLDSHARTEIITSEMEKLQVGFKRWIFPFADLYENVLGFGPQSKNDFNSFVRTEGISVLRMAMTKTEWKSRLLPFDEYLVSKPFGGENDTPFFEWPVHENLESFESLFEGYEIQMESAIEEAMFVAPALKLKTACLRFASYDQESINGFLENAVVEMIHEGNSYYNYEGDVYKFDSKPVRMFSEPSTCKTWSDFDVESYGLSPYGTWRFRLISNQNLDLRELLDQIYAVQLIGIGTYVNGYHEDLKMSKYYTPDSQ